VQQSLKLHRLRVREVDAVVRTSKRDRTVWPMPSASSSPEISLTKMQDVRFIPSLPIGGVRVVATTISQAQGARRRGLCATQCHCLCLGAESEEKGPGCGPQWQMPWRTAVPATYFLTTQISSVPDP
jgi:hypothetical protein